MLCSTLALVLVSTIDLVCGAFPDIDAENGCGIASFLVDQLCAVAEECSEFWGRIGNDIFLAVDLWAYQRNILFGPLKWGSIRGVHLFWLASSFWFCGKIIKRTIKVRSLAIVRNAGCDRSLGGQDNFTIREDVLQCCVVGLKFAGFGRRNIG